MAADSDIQINDLTTAEVEGRGDFDELMRSVKGYLEEEYTKGRITGSNYSDVYLGSMTQVLQTATQFILAKGVTSQQVILLAEQIKTAEQDTLLKAGQVALTTAQTTQITAQTALINQQLLSETENTKLITQNVANAVTQNAVMVKQIEKLEKEIEAAQEGIFNSQAQRVDTVNLLPVAGVLGKQKDLYQAQINGFTRDSEQKLSKILLDTWSVSRTTNDAVQVPENANNTSIDQVLAVAKQGIGLT
jgi:hypothetical protein